MKVTKKGIAKHISDFAEDHDMTLKELSEKSGVSLSRLKMMVSDTPDSTGKKRLPNTDDLLKLADALDISPYELLTGIKDENRKECDNLGLSNDTVNRLRSMRDNRMAQLAIDALVDDWTILEHLYYYFHSDFSKMLRVKQQTDDGCMTVWFNVNETGLREGEYERIHRLRLLDDVKRVRTKIMQSEE